MSAEAMAAPTSGYPVRFDVEYQESHSRLLLFFRWILAIPHLLLIYVLGALSNVCVLIAIFAILFTKKFPKGLYDFVVNIGRWQSNVAAYAAMLRDDYPPFSWEPGQYPVTYEVDYPGEFKRFAPLYKWILAIPNVIVLYIVMIVAVLLWVVAWFAILFTGKMPRGIHDFLVGTGRWAARSQAYYALMLTDQYPPFSMKP